MARSVALSMPDSLGLAAWKASRAFSIAPPKRCTLCFVAMAGLLASPMVMTSRAAAIALKGVLTSSRGTPSPSATSPAFTGLPLERT